MESSNNTPLEKSLKDLMSILDNGFLTAQQEKELLAEIHILELLRAESKYSSKAQ